MRVELSSVQFLVEHNNNNLHSNNNNNRTTTEKKTQEEKKKKKILNDIPNTNYIIIIDTSYQLHITKHRN